MADSRCVAVATFGMPLFTNPGHACFFSGLSIVDVILGFGHVDLREEWVVTTNSDQSLVAYNSPSFTKFKSSLPVPITLSSICLSLRSCNRRHAIAE